MPDTDRRREMVAFGGRLENIRESQAHYYGALVSDSWAPPAWIRIPLLESVLGCPPEELTWQQMQELVSQHAAENLCLDFKAGLYGHKQAIDELCKDVCAFANASGGLIVLGIEEDGHARASGLSGVAITDGERRRMLDATLRIAPLVPDLTIGDLRDPDDLSRGVVLVLIPASAQAPHAIVRDDKFRWPARQDRKTRWMAEAELATRYRDRFRSADEQDRRIEVVATEGRQALHKERTVWLTLALSPATPGRLPLDRHAFGQWKLDAFKDLPWGSVLLGQDVAIGRRRLILSEQTPYRGTSSSTHLEFHQDGSGFAAISLRAQPPNGLEGQEASQSTSVVAAEDLAKWTLTFLDILARHAASAGAGGDFAVQAQLLGGHPPAYVNETIPLAIVEPYSVGAASFGTRLVPGSRPISPPSAARVTVMPGVVRSSRELVTSAAEIVADLLGEFGAIPSNPVLLSGGTVSAEAETMYGLGSIVDWARTQGLLF